MSVFIVFVDCRNEDGDGCDNFEIFCYCGVIGGLSCESRSCSCDIALDDY